MPKPLKEMSRAELLRYEDKLDEQDTQNREAMIEAGRGHGLPSQTAKLSDPLSLAFNETRRLCSEVFAEKRRRMEYHGTLHRIKEIK